MTEKVMALPSLATERLILRERTLADLTASVELDQSQAVTEFIYGVWDGSPRHVTYVKRRIERQYGNGLGYWSIYSQDDPSQFLGWIMLTPVEGNPTLVKIGWRLVRDHWGHGIATEAAQAVTQYAFLTLNLSKLAAGVNPANERGQRVAEKLGFTFKQPISVGDEQLALYILTREHWTDLQRK
ncbi:GNAT family N-acetyltransferase [Levilactobacillus fujinensis]|uniref:GNAT family N-acetyltransferase n=1 Tax=Levilactobacillus fujinensis TaxID=2486024 RepID=A0ABW1TEF4_9LACO|nr:GNAT family N-acetyltransferase [Levilactobacillus fujinensis]